MIRNALAIVGAVALLAYFRGALIPKIPLLVKVPLPQITFNNSTDTNKPGDPNQPATAPTSAPTPQPTPDQKKRWGLEFEYKGRVGL